MKKRTLGLIIAGVAAASMIGTGFAAWVITGNASAELNGNFAVDTVTDKSITLEAEWKDPEDGLISFVGPEQQTTTKWLAYEKSSGITEFADLDETLTLKFGLGNDVAPADYNVTFAFTATGNYANAVTNNYIVNPKMQEIYGINPMKYLLVRSLNRLIRNTCFNHKFDETDYLSRFNDLIEKYHINIKNLIINNVININENSENLKKSLMKLFTSKYLVYPHFLFNRDCKLIFYTINGGKDELIKYENLI